MGEETKPELARTEGRDLMPWMATAYGRRKPAADASAPPADEPNVSPAEEPAPAWRGLATALGDKRRAVAAVVGFSVIVFAVALIEIHGFASPSVVTETAQDTPAGTPQQPSVSASSEDQAQRAELERAEQEAKAQLASERNSRIELEKQVAQLEGEKNSRTELEKQVPQFTSEQSSRVELEKQIAQLNSEIAALKREREYVERTSAATRAELASERKARADAEDAAKSSKEAMARMAADAPAPAVTPPPAPQNPVPQTDAPAEHAAAAPPAAPHVEASPGEASHEWGAKVATASISAPASTNETGSDSASSALLLGQQLFAKGDIAQARQRFEQVANLGRPEGALALGNTYDPVSLAKAGIKQTGDPQRARQWYRRAYELAKSQQEPRQ